MHTHTVTPTYPVRHIRAPLLGAELHDSTVCSPALAITAQLEEHRIIDVKSRKCVERRWREDDLVALFKMRLVAK
jgi:hypothetical protein